MSDKWMSCSICRTDLPFGGTYYACSVSTCNRARTRLVFCSVACWDSHIAVLHHRDAWAVEEKAPTREQWAAQSEEESPPANEPPAPARRVVAPAATAPATAHAADDEVLVVVSKMKKYIRDRSGMNTSDGVAGPLSDWVRGICDEAIEAARAAGRKTVLDRDVPRRR